MGLLAVVPVLGAFVIWVPAAIFLVLDGSEGKALLLTLWGAVVVGGIDNLLYPMLVGKRLRMHTVIAFIFHHEVKTTGFSRLALASLYFKLSFMR